MFEPQNLILIVFITLTLGVIVGFIIAVMTFTDKFKKMRVSSVKTQRSILGGKFAEQLAPYLPGFPEDLKPSEARFVGNPIDFIVYKGISDKNITEVVFVEVKTGQSKLNINEESLRNTINEKRVRWITYRVPEEVTKLKEDINI